MLRDVVERERVAVPVRLVAARLGVAALLAAPAVPSAFLRVLVEPPLLLLVPVREDAERPVPVAFSFAPDARWLALRLAVLALLDEPRLLPDEEDDDDELPLPPSTFCAASATASAISEPSLPTLLAIELAALLALSAASRPASRILRRTDGLALIAAAAAASPAASISLLIAALASLSSVSLKLPSLPSCAALPPPWPGLLPPAPPALPPSGSFCAVKLLLPPWLFDFDVLDLATR